MRNGRLEKRLAYFILYGWVVAALVFFYIPIAALTLFPFTQSRFMSWLVAASQSAGISSC